MKEVEKWSEVAEHSAVIQEFMEFLSSKGINLCILNKDDRFMPIPKPIQDLIYEHFGIDAKKLEKERKQLLEDVQHRANSTEYIA